MSSVCDDGDNDHLCDICEKSLSECVSAEGGRVCSICGNVVPCVTVTTITDCLVNHSTLLEFYGATLPYIEIVPTYEGSPEKEVDYWQILDNSGNLVARIEVGDSYVITARGHYTVIPIFK